MQKERKREPHMDKILLQKTADELDKQFPKGHKERGKGLVIFAIATIEAEKLIQQGISDTIKKVEDILDGWIDHYEPYRPITDSTEMQEVRRALILVKNNIKELSAVKE